MFHIFVVLFTWKVDYLHNKKHGKSMKLSCVNRLIPDASKVFYFGYTFFFFLHDKKFKKKCFYLKNKLSGMKICETMQKFHTHGTHVVVYHLFGHEGVILVSKVKM
jgi:hypothetical protein